MDQDPKRHRPNEWTPHTPSTSPPTQSTRIVSYGAVIPLANLLQLKHVSQSLVCRGPKTLLHTSPYSVQLYLKEYAGKSAWNLEVACSGIFQHAPVDCMSDVFSDFHETALRLKNSVSFPALMKQGLGQIMNDIQHYTNSEGLNPIKMQLCLPFLRMKLYNGTSVEYARETGPQYHNIEYNGVQVRSTSFEMDDPAKYHAEIKLRLSDGVDEARNITCFIKVIHGPSDLNDSDVPNIILHPQFQPVKKDPVENDRHPDRLGADGSWARESSIRLLPPSTSQWMPFDMLQWDGTISPSEDSFVMARLHFQPSMAGLYQLALGIRVEGNNPTNPTSDDPILVAGMIDHHFTN